MLIYVLRLDGELCGYFDSYEKAKAHKEMGERHFDLDRYGDFFRFTIESVKINCFVPDFSELVD